MHQHRWAKKTDDSFYSIVWPAEKFIKSNAGLPLTNNFIHREQPSIIWGWGPEQIEKKSYFLLSILVGGETCSTLLTSGESAPMPYASVARRTLTPV